MKLTIKDVENGWIITEIDEPMYVQNEKVKRQWTARTIFEMANLVKWLYAPKKDKDNEDQ